MYTRNQVARMQPEELISALNDAEKCLNKLGELNEKRNDRVKRKNLLIKECDELQMYGTKIPKPVIIGLVIGFFLCGQLPGLLQWVIIILVIVAIVNYKKYRKAYVAKEVERINTELLPEANLDIEKCDQEIASLNPWVMKVKSLMMKDNMMNLQYVQGIRDQLECGAPNWFEAVKAYEARVEKKADDERKEQHRQTVEQQARIAAANSERAAMEAEAAKRLQEEERRKREEQEAERRKNACPRCHCNFELVTAYESWGEPYKYQMCPNCGYKGARFRI